MSNNCLFKKKKKKQIHVYIHKQDSAGIKTFNCTVGFYSGSVFVRVSLFLLFLPVCKMRGHVCLRTGDFIQLCDCSLVCSSEHLNALFMDM